MVFATTSVPRLATAENDRVALVVGNRATQTWLAELGYEVGPADGLAGPSTQTAIVRFVEDRGVAPAPADSPDLIAQLAPLVSR